MKNIDTVAIDAAASDICSSDTLWLGGTTGTAGDFLDALVARAGELKDVTIIAITGRDSSAALETLKREYGFCVLSFFSDALKQTFTEGDRCKFAAAPAAKMVGAICEKYSVNTAVVPLCPPDEIGMCRVGAGESFVAPAIFGFEGVTKRIALLDPGMSPASGRAAATELSVSGFDVVAGNGGLKVSKPCA